MRTHRLIQDRLYAFKQAVRICSKGGRGQKARVSLQGRVPLEGYCSSSDVVVRPHLMVMRYVGTAL